MKGILARADEARLGRAVAGLVRRELQVVDVVRVGGALRAEVRSVGKRGVQVYGVGIMVVGRDHGVSCSCSDWRKRGVVCKHIVTVALHELGAQAHARSTRSQIWEWINSVDPCRLVCRSAPAQPPPQRECENRWQSQRLARSTCHSQLAYARWSGL